MPHLRRERRPCRFAKQGRMDDSDAGLIRSMAIGTERRRAQSFRFHTYADLVHGWGSGTGWVVQRIPMRRQASDEFYSHRKCSRPVGKPGPTRSSRSRRRRRSTREEMRAVYEESSLGYERLGEQGVARELPGGAS